MEGSRIAQWIYLLLAVLVLTLLFALLLFLMRGGID